MFLKIASGLGFFSFFGEFTARRLYERESLVSKTVSITTKLWVINVSIVRSKTEVAEEKQQRANEQKERKIEKKRKIDVKACFFYY